MRASAPVHGAQPAPRALAFKTYDQRSRQRRAACQAQSLGAAVRSWFSGVFSQAAPSKRGQVMGMRSAESAASTVQRPPQEGAGGAGAASSAPKGDGAIEEARAKLQDGELMATTHKSIEEV